MHLETPTEEELQNLFKISPSSLSRYTQCGLMYYFDKFLKRPGASYTAFGKACHSFCELVINKMDDEDSLIRLLLIELKTIKEIGEYEQRFLKDKSLQKKFAANIKNILKDFNIVQTELFLAKKLDDFIIRGYIDAITSDDEIIDFKFGKNKSEAEDHILQLSIYAALYSELKKDMVCTVISFPKRKRDMKHHISSITVSVGQQKNILNIIQSQVAAIKKERYMPCRYFSNILCNSCHYKSICLSYIKGEFNEL